MQYKGQRIHSNALHGWHALCVSLVHVYLQSSLAGETFTAKHSFESTLQSFGFSVSNYHGDYGIFASRAFKDDCHVKKDYLQWFWCSPSKWSCVTLNSDCCCFCMLQFIGLQLLISNYGHLPYNMLFILEYSSKSTY